MAEQINPTRMNLLAKRTQIRLARQGADLLSRKKDALLREFFGLVAAVHESRVRLADALRREMVEVVVAEATEGKHVLASASLSVSRDLRVRLTRRNLWGVSVVEMEHDFRPRDASSPARSPRGMQLAADEIAIGFEKIAEDMLKLAPHELRLRRVGEEVRRTNRKINALQQHVIPKLESQSRYINEVLEQRARDDVIRLKRLKQKKRRDSPTG